MATEKDVRANFRVGSLHRLGRLDGIIAALEDSGRITLAELVERTGASAATLRRDLALLADMGVLVRSHGGAMLGPASAELPVAVRDTRQRDTKRRIAEAVARMIPPGRRAIALSGGSTAAAVARALSTRPDLTIVTNSLTVAELPQTYPHMRVIVTGGTLRPQSGELVGIIAEKAFASINTETAVLGADGVDAVQGFTTHEETEARTNHAMIARARRTIVVADSSKIGRVTLAQMAAMSEVDVLVTDGGIGQDRLAELREIGLETVVV